MDEESNESETKRSESPHEISERSQRFKRRLDYAEYSNDEDEKEPTTSKRGKKERKARPGNMGAQKKNRTRFSEEEVADMWLFIIERLRHPVTQKVIKLRSGAQIWKEFKKENNSNRNELSFYVHFRRSMIPTLDLTNFDMQTKTILHYALEIPCTREFIRELREDEKVEVIVNENDLITAYRKIKSGHFHEDDGWDEVWGDDVIQNGSITNGGSVGTSGPRGGRQSARLEEPYDSQDGEMWSSMEQSHLENYSSANTGDELYGHDDDTNLEPDDDSDEYGKVPKRKKMKKAEKKFLAKEKTPGERGRKRRERKEKLLLVEQKKHEQDQRQKAFGKSTETVAVVAADQEQSAEYNDLQHAETSNLPLQLDQSWAAVVYTPLVDPFEKHSPELANFRV